MSQPSTLFQMLGYLNRLGRLLLAVLALLYIDPIVTALATLAEHLGIHLDPNLVALPLVVVFVVTIGRMTFKFLVSWKGANTRHE